MLIVCGGLMRTGSVAMFQIMREIVESKSVGFAPVMPHGEEGEYYDSECVRWAAQPESFVTKLHTYRNSLDDIIEQNAQDLRVVLTIRDIRDILVSLMHFRNSSFESNIHSNAYKNWIAEYDKWIDNVPEDSLLTVRYEDFIADRFTTILKVGKFMDLPLNAPEAKAIDEKWNVEANRRRATEGHPTNSKEFMSQRHIYQAGFGMWEEELTEEQIEIVEEYAGEWLKQNGYV